MARERSTAGHEEPRSEIADTGAPDAHLCLGFSISPEKCIRCIFQTREVFKEDGGPAIADRGTGQR